MKKIYLILLFIGMVFIFPIKAEAKLCKTWDGGCGGSNTFNEKTITCEPEEKLISKCTVDGIDGDCTDCQWTANCKVDSFCTGGGGGGGSGEVSLKCNCTAEFGACGSNFGKTNIQWRQCTFSGTGTQTCNWHVGRTLYQYRACIIATPTPTSTAKSCSISLSTSSITTSQSVTVTSSGTGGTLWKHVSRTDTGTINGLGNPVYTDGQGHKYYAFTGNSLSGLDVASYKVWCAVVPNPDPDHPYIDPDKCSGNPFCTYEGGSLSCAGWVSCSGSDNANLTVNTNSNSTGDADGDGDVDFKDYFYFVAKKSGANIPSSVNVDFNGDGVVDDKDRSIIIATLKAKI